MLRSRQAMESNALERTSGNGQNRRHSGSIEMATFGFSPYEIPTSSGTEFELDGYSLPSINTVTTTLEYGDRYDPTSDLEKDQQGQMPHGFFFGSASTELLSNQPLDGGSEKENANGYSNISDDDDDEDYEDVERVYKNNAYEKWVRASQHSFKPSPEICKREVLSKRIKDVGLIGQNLGIGHLTGVYKEDAVLIPKAVCLQSYYFLISETCPLQQDLSWDKPENASTFSTLTYKIDVMIPEQETWTPLTSVRHQVFRIYHTDHKLFIGKMKIDRQNHDLNLGLRVCCQGEMSFSDGAKHWRQGPWSKEVTLVFSGYGFKPEVLEQTAL